METTLNSSIPACLGNQDVRPTTRNTYVNSVVDEQHNTVPPQYSWMTVDVISFCLANDIPFCEGNVIKYVCRWREKNGLEDLYKARNYIDRLIADELRNKVRN